MVMVTGVNLKELKTKCESDVTRIPSALDIGGMVGLITMGIITRFFVAMQLTYVISVAQEC